MNKHELAAYVRENLIEAQRKLAAGEPIEGRPLEPFSVVVQTTPTVDLSIKRGAYYPDMAPALPEEDDDAYTNRLTGADGTGRQPYDHVRFRECSIGFHLSCTNDGTECQCPHHRDVRTVTVTATDVAATLGRLYYLPITTAKNVMDAVRGTVGRAGSFGMGRRVEFDEIRDAIAAARPYYSRPGNSFTVDVINLLQLADLVTGMPGAS